MRWLAECSAEALRAALEVVAPELSTCDVPVPEPAGEDPQYHKSSLVVGDRFIVKFAWSRPAALQLGNEIGVLTTLSAEPAVPFLPEVVASSMDPLLLVTRRVPGTSLFDVVGSIDLDRAAGQLASFLTGWSRAGATGPTPCSPRPPLPRCSSTAICTVITRCGAATSCGATMRHYERLSGRKLSLERVMAWHMRTALGDVVWRTEAGIPLADHRTPPDWIDDLAARFRALGMRHLG